MKVFKYELPIAETFTLELPQGAEIKAIQVQQRNTYSIIGIVNSDAPVEKRSFKILGVGAEVSSNDTYIDSFQINNGLVYLLFEI